MRSYLAISAIALTSVLGLCSTMCSSSSDSSGTATPSGDLAQGRFQGVLSGAGDLSGVIDLTATPQASTGTASNGVKLQDEGHQVYALSGTLTLNVPGLGVVNLTGTLDLATNTANFTGTAFGGAVPFVGTYAAGAINGYATVGGRRAPFTATNASLGVKLYCGSFAGGLEGRWSVLAAGNQMGAVFATSDGRDGTGTGTLNDVNLVTFALSPEGNATGTVSSGSLTGSWNWGGTSGSFAASESACNALTPAGTLPDGGVLPGQDGGPGGESDGGVPGAVETIYTAPEAVKIKFLTFAGSKIAFALDHVSYSQVVTLRSINTDGSGVADIIPTSDAGTAQLNGAIGGLSATASKVFYLGGWNPPADSANVFSIPIGGGTPTLHGVLSGAPSQDFAPGTSSFINDGTTVWASHQGASDHKIRTFSVATGESLGSLTKTGALGLGIDGNDLYFGDFFGLNKIAKGLTGESTLVVDKTDYSEFGFVMNVAFDAENIYYAWNAAGGSRSGGIMRKPRAGGASQPIVAAQPGWIRSLTLVDGQFYYTYWTASGGQQGGPTTSSSKLMRVSKTATNATPIEVAPANNYDVLYDGTNLYFGAGNAIKKMHK